jgi:hypothetical protein
MIAVTSMSVICARQATWGQTLIIGQRQARKGAAEKGCIIRQKSPPGVVGAAKGMSPAAELDCYNWNNGASQTRSTAGATASHVYPGGKH